MNIKTLLNVNKKSFSIYLMGAFLTSANNLFATLALSVSFKILEAQSQSELIKIISLVAFLGFLPIVLQICSRYMRIGFMKDILVEVRIMSFQKLMAMRVSDFSSKSISEYQSNLVSDINLFEQEFFLSLLNIIFSGASYIIYLVVLLFISKEIFLIVLLSSVLVYIVSLMFRKPILNSKEKLLNENTIYQKSIANMLVGLDTIKLYGASKRFLNVFKRDVAKYEKTASNDYAVNNYLANVSYFISFLLQCVAYVYAAYLFSTNRLSISMLVIVLNLSGSTSWAIVQLMNMINRFKSSILIYDNLVKFNIEEYESLDFSLNDEINVSNLSYSYGDDKVLENVNLKIRLNDKVLLYGESGSGKTTLVNSLLKALVDYEGEIVFDNQEVSEIKYLSLLDHVGYVRQEHFLFDESIKNNVILDKEFNEERFYDVLSKVNLLDFVKSLDNKEDFELVSNGSNISGGQRQRINIARELYRDKPIIILDEPSSSLDDYNASIIYESILSLDKTIIIISHRHLQFLVNNVDVALDLSKGVY